VLGAPFCDSSGGERAIVRQIMQEVAAFGRESKELYRPVTETEIAEDKLARKVRQRGLRKEVQEMSEKLKASRDTSSGRSSLAAGGKPLTASGDSHPVANLPHSAASATAQEPSPVLRKRLRKATTAPPYDAGASGGPHLAATVADRVTKRSLGDPYTSSAKSPQARPR